MTNTVPVEKLVKVYLMMRKKHLDMQTELHVSTNVLANIGTNVYE